jgi:hypothetical protein
MSQTDQQTSAFTLQQTEQLEAAAWLWQNSMPILLKCKYDAAFWKFR